MQFYGNGVTRNFLQILEGDLRRAARGLAVLTLLTGIVALVAYFVLTRNLLVGFAGFLAALVLGGAGGIAWTWKRGLRRYEDSIRDHWNRWMRFSVSCVSVGECYAKVHGKSVGPSWWIGGLFFTVLLLAHVALGLLIINEEATLAQQFPVLGADAILLGFFAGRRLVERVWYQRFLQSCNELLREGRLGIWGVY